MKIIVFGATGKTGVQIVQQALENGHKVTAYARTPSKMTISHTNLQVVEGDVLDKPTVQSATMDQDIVICSLGSNSLGKTTLRTDGTRNIIQAMQSTEVKRLLIVSSLGANESRSQIGFVFRTIASTLLRNVIKDHEAQEDITRDSGLDWTIVRPGGLSDKPLTGEYNYGTDSSIGSGQIARADVAHFLIKVASENLYIQEAVAVI